MSRVSACLTSFLFGLALLAAGRAAQAAPAAAGDNAAFLQSVRGAWSGQGQVVAGRYKGVKFSCRVTAPDAAGLSAMQFNGSCRAGIFSQPIKASISRVGGTYQGSFNEGAQGNGMDITAGQIENNRMILQLHREKLQGSMTAQLSGANLMHITLAVQIDDESIPVIGMDLTRTAPADSLANAKGQSMFAWLGN